jgi:hypothetical protein
MITSYQQIKVFLDLFLQKKNRRKDSSFSEEEEVKRLFSIRLGRL